jgi:hypothetical protein
MTYKILSNSFGTLILDKSNKKVFPIGNYSLKNFNLNNVLDIDCNQKSFIIKKHNKVYIITIDFKLSGTERGDDVLTNDVLTNDVLTNDVLTNDVLTNDVLTNDVLINKISHKKYQKIIILDDFIAINNKHTKIITIFNLKAEKLHNFKYNLYACSGNTFIYKDNDQYFLFESITLNTIPLQNKDYSIKLDDNDVKIPYDFNKIIKIHGLSNGYYLFECNNTYQFFHKYLLDILEPDILDKELGFQIDIKRDDKENKFSLILTYQIQQYYNNNKFNKFYFNKNDLLLYNNKNLQKFILFPLNYTDCLSLDGNVKKIIKANNTLNIDQLNNFVLHKNNLDVYELSFRLKYDNKYFDILSYSETPNGSNFFIEKTKDDEKLIHKIEQNYVSNSKYCYINRNHRNHRNHRNSQQTINEAINSIYTKNKIIHKSIIDYFNLKNNIFIENTIEKIIKTNPNSYIKKLNRIFKILSYNKLCNIIDKLYNSKSIVDIDNIIKKYKKILK